MPDSAPLPPVKIATGIAGLDGILNGGLPADELHALTGGAGTGKTTFALEFLRHGAKAGEKTLFITLSQCEAALRKIALSHGWSLEGVAIHEIAFPGLTEQQDSEQTIFRTGDVELLEIIAGVCEAVERIQPARLVFDSVNQLRSLANDATQLQRQLFALRQFFMGKHCTVLLLDSGMPDREGLNATEDLSHGSIALERWAPDYGNVRRRLIVTKMRGLAFHGGYHNFRIGTGGLEVFGRLSLRQELANPSPNVLQSGLEPLDAQLGGGLDHGSSTLILGPTGTGKSSIATLYAHAAASRGQRVAMFLFEEDAESFIARSAGLKIDLRPFVKNGVVTVQQINAGGLSPGEFSETVRRAVEEKDATVVVIDSLTGYFHAMPHEQLLLTQMRNLLSFLCERDVLSLLIVAQHGIVGNSLGGPIDVSYMSDTLLLLRHFDAGGSVRKAISVLKKRTGPHEFTIRELSFGPGGIRVGEPLLEFSNVLSGTPVFHGDISTLWNQKPGVK